MSCDLNTWKAIWTMPFFSVVIPLYNKENYIERSIDSILNQTEVNFEIVVVDDGSTDSGPRIVKSYSDPRIRLISQRNAGVSVARNRGITEASAKWITFLDADDEYYPLFLQEISCSIDRFPDAGLIYSDLIWLRGGVQLNKRRQSSEEPELLEDYFHFIVFQEGSEIHPSCVAIKKEAFSTAGLFPVGVKVGEDSDLWMRVAWTTKIAHIPKFLSVYHMDAGDSNWEEERLQEAHWVQTYRQWRLQGRIPKGQLRSTEAYYQRYVLAKALRHVFRGEKAAARKILSNKVTWSAAPKKYALKVLLYAFLPIAKIRSLYAGRKNTWKAQ